MTTCLLTGGLFPWTGGPVRSVGAFQRALDASVVSFVASEDAAHYSLRLSASQLALVRCRKLPGMRHFLVPSRASLRAAEPMLERADLVSCHSFYNSYPLWLWRHASRTGKPYWFVPHGILDPFVMRSSIAAKRAYTMLFGRRFLSNASATVFSTTAERDKAIKVARVANPQVILWPVGIPPLHDRDVCRTELQGRFNLPPNAKVMLFLGRLHTMKRPEETIRLFAAAASVEWHLLFVGYPDNVTVERLLAVTSLCGVRGRVHIIDGATHDAAVRIIQACDLFVSFSQRENFNNAAAECLAAGLPLLLSAGNDLLSALEGMDAVGVLPEDIPAAVRVVTAWTKMADSERRQRGQIGRDWAQRHLGFKAFARSITDLRADCVGAG